MSLTQILLFPALFSQAPALPAASAAPELTQPILTKFIQAPYPEEAARLGLTATVHLVLYLSREGKVNRVLVESPVGQGFDQAAVEAAKQFLFTPATRGGAPIEAVVELDYRFTLSTPLSAPDSGPPTVPLLGVVREKGTRRPLSGARVSLPELQRTAETDAEGRFELFGLTPGRYLVAVELPEYFPFSSHETAQADRPLELSFSLEPKTSKPFETLVRGRRSTPELASTTVQYEEIRHLPGVQGDPVRVVSYLPGVARSPLGLPVLVIRGSLPRESAVLLDGHTIPFLYHFDLLKTVLSAELIDSVDFLPGGFGAYHGDQLGGIVDVRTRKPRGEGVHGSVVPALIDSSLTLEAPLPWVPKLTLAAGASYGYLGPLIRTIGGDVVAEAPLPDFHDFQARADYEPAPSHRLTLLAFGAADRSATARRSDQPEDTPQVFERLNAFYSAQLRHEYSFWGASDRLNTLSASYVNYRSSTTLAGQSERLVQSWLELRENLELPLFSSLKLQGGYFGRLRPLADDPQLEGPQADPSRPSVERVKHEPNTAYSSSLYAEARWQAAGPLLIVPGLRFNYTLFTHSVRPQRSWDPRLSARLALNPATTLKASLGWFHQTSLDAWRVPALRPEEALHATVGAERRIAQALQLSVELFYKQLSSLVVAPDTFRLSDQLLRPVGELFTNEGEGRVYGLELLLRHDLSRNLFGWVAYTLSRSERRRAGRAYTLFALDQTHLLTVVAAYKLPYHWDLSLAFRLASGNPETPIRYGLYDADHDFYLPAPGEPNSARLPASHQLDLRVAKTWAFDAWRLTGHLELINVYHQRRSELAFWSFDYTQRQELKGIGFYPSLGLKGEW